jgi:hypothetical protein
MFFIKKYQNIQPERHFRGLVHLMWPMLLPAGASIMRRSGIAIGAIHIAPPAA